MARRRCTKCGSKNVARILYGYPIFTPELEKELDEGRTTLGGCSVMGGGMDPRWSCNDCDHCWPNPFKD